MKLRLTSLCLIAVLTVASCAARTSVRFQDASISATGQLNRVSHPKWGDVVWGKLTIEGLSRPLKSADLDCFALRIGDSVSENTYYTSIASVSTSDYPALDGKVIAPVYWPMKDFAGGTNADLARAELSLRPHANGSCFEFE